jgi:hypothetical protein
MASPLKTRYKQALSNAAIHVPEQGRLLQTRYATTGLVGCANGPCFFSMDWVTGK